MSARSAVMSTMDKMRSKGVRSVEVKKADNGGYIAETRHEDYAQPSKTTVHKNHKDLAAHINKVMPCK
jgi:hypothetical protein